MRCLISSLRDKPRHVSRALPCSSSRSWSSPSCCICTRGGTWSTSSWWCCWWLCSVRTEAEASRLGSGLTAGTVFGNQSSFLLPGYQKRPPVSSWGGQINTDQKFLIAASLIHEWASLTLIYASAASLTVISVKAVSGMITESIKGQLQFIYPIFYVMLVIMFASCGFQIKSVSFPLFTLLFIAQSPCVHPRLVTKLPNIILKKQWLRAPPASWWLHLLPPMASIAFSFAFLPSP